MVLGVLWPVLKGPAEVSFKIDWLMWVIIFISRGYVAEILVVCTLLPFWEDRGC